MWTKNERTPNLKDVLFITIKTIIIRIIFLFLNNN